jgi:hypothetical protein
VVSGEFYSRIGSSVSNLSHPVEQVVADSEEKHEPAGDIDTVVVDSLKALDPERPIREADIAFSWFPVPYSYLQKLR